MKLSESRTDYKIMYLESQDEVRALQHNVKLNRQMLRSLMEEEKIKELKHRDEVEVLNNLLRKQKQEQIDEVKELKQEIARLKLDLEFKEYDLQYKENKWGELDKIIVNYAREDEKLQEELAQIRYLCDDYTTERKITTVVSENQKLKKRNKKIKNELKEMKYASERGDRSNSGRKFTGEDFTSKANSVENFENLLSNLDENEDDLDDNLSNNLLPPKRNGASTTKNFRVLKVSSDDNTGSTKEYSEIQNDEKPLNKMKEVRLPVPSTFKPKPLAIDAKFDFLNKSGGNLDEGLAFYDEEVSPIKRTPCNNPNQAFNFFDEFAN